MYALHGRNTADCALAYTELFGWKVLPGYRFRRHAGCTCKRRGCRAPGAHPVDESLLQPVEAMKIPEVFNQRPGAGLIALCEGFDAVTMPYELGLSVLLEAEGAGLGVPCLTVPGMAATILVAMRTGQHLARLDSRIRVVERWVALPPTHDVRWESLPSPELALTDAADLTPHLTRAVRLHRPEPVQSALRSSSSAPGEGGS
ncbi:hypothetical protein AB0N81_11090 [Streptomyces sp. NPDC093510]|uniref:hypothetical protein n=1 Tax=Streptomyces sp. NPDC093510 TaxID=3155199 RepID=UPI003440586A